MDAERTLQNNKINQFILRIDLSADSNVNFKLLADSLKDQFDSYRTELHVNYNVNIQKEEVNKEDFIKYLLGMPPKTNIKIDSFEKSIIIESLQYENNSAYEKTLTNIINALKNIDPNICSRRIGMRYVNNFPCSKLTDVSKILNASDAKAIKEVAGKDNIARAMIVHEYQCGNNLIRVQYGIPNKFYPSVLSNYDVVLDIDVYSGGLQNIDLWRETIKDYNHQAYNIFIEYIKDSFLKTLQ